MEKYKVKAKKLDLEEIGIYYDIDGLTGDLIRNYLTGWLCLKIIHKVGLMEFTNEFDLPKYMCVVVFKQ